jgi:hypothetical protein
MADDIKRFESGAESSGAVLRYDLVPRNFLERVAARFGLGEAKYGELAYRKGLRDRAFIIDRLNHLQQHLQAYIAPQNVDEAMDDNLAAIGWAAAFLCEVEADRVGAQILFKIRAERGQSIQVKVKRGDGVGEATTSALLKELAKRGQPR